MAKTIHTGALWSGPGLSGSASNPLHSHGGRILAILVSHAETTAQTLTFYDATSLPSPLDDEVLVLHIAPEQSPYYIRFARDEGIPFSTGLFLAGANCDVHLWSVDYG